MSDIKKPGPAQSPAAPTGSGARIDARPPLRPSLPQPVRAALAVALIAAPAAAQSGPELRALRAQMDEMAQRIEELEAQQAATEDAVRETRESAVVTAGERPGTFRLPGSSTELQFGGSIKTDLIYDADEALGDLFVPEAITTRDGGDEQRFRAHARQSRLFFRSFTPTDRGETTTWLEGDFFGGGGNQVFSNSYQFRLRHAVASVGGLTAGQTWSLFMPIESYPSTVDFNGPAGVTFIRQAQVRYTHALNDNLSLAASLENSELSARREDGTAIAESINLGIRAGVDKAPDVVVAATWRDDWSLVKAAALGRVLGNPGTGDDEFGWGVNLSGDASLWPGGKLLGAVTYGDGLGRYLINGFGQDAFARDDGSLDTIRAWSVMAGVSHKLTEEVTVGLTYGRRQFEDSLRGADLDNVNTIHLTARWSPIPRLTLGAEAIWGDREDADGASDDALRLQTAVQLNF